MTTRATSGEPPLEPPRKRQRFSPSATIDTNNQQSPNPESKPPHEGTENMENGNTQTTVFNDALQAEREAAAGILHFVNSTNPGFAGVLKQRYTDFIVNEIALDGIVVHLAGDKAPEESKAPPKDNPLPEAQNDVKLQQETGAKLGGTEVEKPKETEEKVKADSGIHVQPTETEKEKAKDPSASENGGADSTQSIPTVTFAISKDDDDVLEKYFGIDLKNEVLKFHSKVLAKPYAKPAQFGSLLTNAITDRVLRGRIHQDVRRIFQSRLETVSIEEGKIQITAASKAVAAMHGRHGAPLPLNQLPRGRHATQAKGKLGWQELGGEYLHFSLYKENKDTMEVLGFLSKQLHVKPRDFAFAGTKDRRAVTVQRVSVFRQHFKDLAKLNRSLRQARIGGFKYQKQKLELGELMGNQFTVALRDCHFDGEVGLEDSARVQLAKEVVSRAIEHIKVHGFINYFGLQRFGTYGIGTDVVGRMILKEDFEGAVKAILTYNDTPLPGADPNSRVGRDDLDRAKAIKAFESTGTSADALKFLPRKFGAETSLIRHLSIRDRRSDYCGALLTITRNLRTMYVHAYQSLVWNVVASERWSRYGDKVVEGDLILVESKKMSSEAIAAKDEVDENGEVVIHPAQDDAAVQHDDLFDRARPLSAEEAASGQYSIFDLVLPTPGWDIEYPSNDIGDFYKEFMGSERGGGLDPANMRRKQKDFSLSGSYRKVMAQMGQNLSFEVKTYHHETEQLVETDLDKIEKTHPKSQPRFGHQNQYTGNGARDNQNGWHNNSHEARGGRNNHARGPESNTDRSRHSSNNNFGRNGAPHDGPRRSDGSTDSGLSQPTSQLSAWQTLPSKLAADDKQAAAAAQYKYDNEPPIDPNSIKQPEYRETYIETLVDDAGRKTVSKTVKIVGTDGVLRDVQEESKPSEVSKSPSVAAGVEGAATFTTVTEIPTPGLASKMEIDSSKPAEDALAAPEKIQIEQKAATAESSFTDEQDGGVQLSPVLSAKRSADQMSSIPAVESGQGPIAKAAKIEVLPQELGAATAPGPLEEVGPAKLAVIITFSLNSSQYATMALRELMKAGGVKTYKPDFSGGR